MKSKNYLSLTLFLSAGLALATQVRAVCPVCVVAVGAGLGLSRWLGVDDVVSSIWIGAILVALSLWTINWMRKRNWKFSFDTALIFLAYYALTFVPLHYSGLLWHPSNTIWGMDKIIFGTIAGTLVFIAATWLHNLLKKKNGGKSYFPYQKVVLPVAVLLIISSILYYLLK